MGALAEVGWAWSGRGRHTLYGVKCARLTGRGRCAESRPELETVNK